MEVLARQGLLRHGPGGDLDGQIIRDTKMQHSTGECLIATLLPPVLPTTKL